MLVECVRVFKLTEPFYNIKLIGINEEYIIIVNEYNEFYVKGYLINVFENYFDYFKRINLNCYERIKILQCGKDNLFILTNKNNVYGLGNNESGQLGLQNIELVTTFTKIENLQQQVKDISCSDDHALLLDLFGNIYTTGANSYGQLGLGDNNNRNSFTKVDLPFKVIKIFADECLSLIVNENYEVFGVGYNEDGQLGLGHEDKLTTFTKFIINNNCKSNYNFFTSFTGTLYILDNKNDIYFSGELEDIFGININNDKKHLNKFTKLQIFKTKRKYCYIMPMEYFTIFITCDFKIKNRVEDGEEDNVLGIKCFEVLNEKNGFIDLLIYCNDFNYKKRKRIY